MRNKRERLSMGETFITSEKGNSMLPIIESKQHFELIPYSLDHCIVGDIVYCKVKRHYYTHIVKAVDAVKGVLIGNNQGLINGWTKKVFGKVSRVLTKEEEKKSEQGSKSKSS